VHDTPVGQLGTHEPGEVELTTGRVEHDDAREVHGNQRDQQRVAHDDVGPQGDVAALVAEVDRQADLGRAHLLGGRCCHDHLLSDAGC